MQGWYASGRMHLTDEARVVGRAIATDMPVPRLMTPGIKATNLVVIGMLPPEVRALYDPPWTPAHRVAWRALTLAVRRSQPVVPRGFRQGDNRDLHRTVIRRERDLVRQGRVTLQLPG
jgi:uncharacterized protein (DUF2236 family)